MVGWIDMYVLLLLQWWYILDILLISTVVHPWILLFEYCMFLLTEKIERTVQIEASTVEIEERGVKLRLTVVDTPGYGDAINSQDWWEIPSLLRWRIFELKKKSLSLVSLIAEGHLTLDKLSVSVNFKSQGRSNVADYLSGLYI